MLYKTIVLELLQQRPQLHEQLRKERQMLSTLNRYAMELKASHLEIIQELAQARPGSHSAQIKVEAMEMAIAELVDRLPNESSPGDETLSLDEAIVHVRRPLPRG